MLEEYPIDLFDDATQGNSCGEGDMIKVVEDKATHFRVGLGIGTNSKAELIVVCVLMFLASTLKHKNIKFLGDSKCVIDWLARKAHLDALKLVACKKKIE